MGSREVKAGVGLKVVGWADGLALELAEGTAVGLEVVATDVGSGEEGAAVVGAADDGAAVVGAANDGAAVDGAAIDDSLVVPAAVASDVWLTSPSACGNKIPGTSISAKCTKREPLCLVSSKTTLYCRKAAFWSRKTCV